MKILKTHNNDILIRELFVKITTVSGLYNPEADKQHPFRVGVVVKVDNSDKFFVGDVVAFDIYAGVTITHEGKEHVILAEKTIFATIENEGEFVEKEQR